MTSHCGDFQTQDVALNQVEAFQRQRLSPNLRAGMFGLVRWYSYLNVKHDYTRLKESLFEGSEGMKSWMKPVESDGRSKIIDIT